MGNINFKYEKFRQPIPYEKYDDFYKDFNKHLENEFMRFVDECKNFLYQSVKGENPLK